MVGVRRRARRSPPCVASHGVGWWRTPLGGCGGATGCASAWWGSAGAPAAALRAWRRTASGGAALRACCRTPWGGGAPRPAGAAVRRGVGRHGGCAPAHRSRHLVHGVARRRVVAHPVRQVRRCDAVRGCTVGV